MPLNYLFYALSLLLVGITSYFLFKKFKASRATKKKSYQLSNNEFLPPQMVLNINDIDYNFCQYGKGPDLLLIHGIGASIYTWRFVIKELGKNFKVTALDLPGFGLSSKPSNISYDLDAQSNRVLDFCKRLSLQDVYVVGSSMGGTIALRMTQLKPQQFAKAILISPALSPTVSPINGTYIKYFSIFMPKFISKGVMKQILKRVLYNNKNITDKQIESQRLPYKKPDAIYTFLAALKTVKDKRLPELFKQTPVAYKVIHGKEDLIIPLKQISACVKKIKTKNFEILTDAGHHPMEDRPEKVIESLNEFYKNQD